MMETNNPTTYTIESQTIELEAPTERDYYVFVGWYTHPEAGIKVEVIITGTTGHITLYSRWIPVEYSIFITYQKVY